MFDFKITYNPTSINIIAIASNPCHLSFVSLLFNATINLFSPFARMNPPIISLITNSIIPLQNIIIIPITIDVIPNVSCMFDTVSFAL